ncbi:Glycosyl hydrolase family 85 [Nesidiocoris tenuis]|uniref:Glycosyl hydrolase family 85 n=1 Tax=Nesidiocoris tenuis TaxID=355587 RepID=A0ABN7AUE3_9HEMI|nr:Glycosyl hydrolase family 85 [Nesidiocoris tenuis]
MACVAPACGRPQNQEIYDKNDMLTCYPIDNVEMVLDWEAPKQSWASKVVPRLKRTKQVYKGYIKCEQDLDPNVPISRRLVPKTLFCHDMRGGYLDDRFVEGCEDDSAFNFFRWSVIDIFVYFSHNFLTIPPVTWINAAHRNGVPVLGTIITEGEKGEELCQLLFNDREKVQRLCEKLAFISEHYGFSGYLLNIENIIQEKHLDNLLYFVMELNSQLKNFCHDNILLWYDSVDVRSGKLDWQNKLNQKNKSFFDTCDGIFLNYGWTEECLQISLRNAEERNLDVYVGVDVFGRGCLGGGGFNCCEPMSMIRRYNLSAAIFAPGWVHETLEEDEEHTFLQRDYKFWACLYDYLFVSGPGQLPFETSFCVGSGLNTYHKGRITKKGRWHNIGKQDFQICDLIGWANFEEHSCISYYENDAYNGGTCLILKKPNAEEKHHEHRLFVCEFRTTDYDYLILKITVKLLGESNGNFELYIRTISEDGAENKHYLKPDKDTYHKLSAKRWVNRIFSTDPGIGTVVELGYRMYKIDAILLGRIRVIKEPLTL